MLIFPDVHKKYMTFATMILIGIKEGKIWKKEAI